jgi:hypothetical protein
MKKLLIILSFFPSTLINAQVIDWNNFNERTMNDILFNKMNHYTESNAVYSIIRLSVGKQRIYKLIKKNNEKLLLEDLNAEINKVLRKYDSKIIKRTNQIRNVGIIDSVSCRDVKTYEDIASRCITDWVNTPTDAFYLVGWSIVGDAVTVYNKKTNTVYLVFTYLH